MYHEKNPSYYYSITRHVPNFVIDMAMYCGVEKLRNPRHVESKK